MKRTLLLLAFLGLTSNAVAESMPPAILTQTSDGIKIEAKLSPSHPTVKQFTNVTLFFSDEATGDLVKVKNVSVNWEMEGMQHKAKPLAARQVEEGIHSVRVKPPMSGDLALVVSATKNGKPITVKMPTHAMDVTRGMKGTMGHE